MCNEFFGSRLNIMYLVEVPFLLSPGIRPSTCSRSTGIKPESTGVELPHISCGTHADLRSEYSSCLVLCLRRYTAAMYRYRNTGPVKEKARDVAGSRHLRDRPADVRSISWSFFVSSLRVGKVLA